MLHPSVAGFPLKPVKLKGGLLIKKRDQISAYAETWSHPLKNLVIF